MSKHWSKIGVVTIALILLSSTVLPFQGVAAAPNAAAARCQCVRFVTNKLFFRDGQFYKVKNGNWPWASSLATQAYWDQAYKEFPYAGLRRQVVNPTNARPNDVIIMQPNARVYVYYPGQKSWILWDKIGSGYGHIGIVLSANYHDSYSINGKGMGGWQITMQSANWDVNFDNGGLSIIEDGSPASVNGGFAESYGCSNVNNSWIFLPNGNPVSFWRIQ